MNIKRFINDFFFDSYMFAHAWLPIGLMGLAVLIAHLMGEI